MNQENDKLGYTLGDLLKMIHKGQMSLAQASHYGRGFYDLESAIYAIETLLSEERGRVIEEIADIAKRRAFEGEYKGCPAAWLNMAYENFEKAIRNLKESP